jgi:hypothetical protein
LKVYFFSWRLLRDGLPTKIYLVTRGIITSDSHFCKSGWATLNQLSTFVCMVIFLLFNQLVATSTSKQTDSLDTIW